MRSHAQVHHSSAKFSRSGLIALSAMASMALCAPPIAHAAGSAPDGAKIYEQACATCHSGGPGGLVSGAPKLGAKSWQFRLQKAGSIEELVSIAAAGKGKMPAQGGSAGLSDPAIKAAIEYILSKAVWN